MMFFCSFCYVFASYKHTFLSHKLQHSSNSADLYPHYCTLPSVFQLTFPALSIFSCLVVVHLFFLQAQQMKH